MQFGMPTLIENRTLEENATLCEEWIGGSDIVIAVENTDGFRAYEKKAISYLL